MVEEPTLFTRIFDGDIPANFIARGDDWAAFLDIFPRRPGHTLVIPAQQVRRMSDLSTEQLSSLWEGVVRTQNILSSHFRTTDFSVGIHDGPLSGQEVPHVHVHVIPREQGDGGRTLLACWPNTPSPGSSEPDYAGLSSLCAEIAASNASDEQPR